MALLQGWCSQKEVQCQVPSHVLRQGANLQLHSTCPPEHSRRNPILPQPLADWRNQASMCKILFLKKILLFTSFFALYKYRISMISPNLSFSYSHRFPLLPVPSTLLVVCSMLSAIPAVNRRTVKPELSCQRLEVCCLCSSAPSRLRLEPGDVGNMTDFVDKLIVLSLRLTNK